MRRKRVQWQAVQNRLHFFDRAVHPQTGSEEQALGSGYAQPGHASGLHLLAPPEPPVPLTPSLALDPTTDEETLWRIARCRPDLRRWLIANPASTPVLLEYVSQAGGEGVKTGFEVFFEEREALKPTGTGSIA